jgi:hypothetical protein
MINEKINFESMSNYHLFAYFDLSITQPKATNKEKNKLLTLPQPLPASLEGGVSTRLRRGDGVGD